MKFRLSAFILCSLSSLPIAYAQHLDSASQEALQKTQELLKDPAARRQAIKGDPKGQSADKMVDQISGGGTAKEDVYGLASDVFAELVKETGGDAKKMEDLLAQFARNPAAFTERWTPEQRARLKALAEKLNPHNNPK